jgi:tellurite resistance protein TerC
VFGMNIPLWGWICTTLVIVVVLGVDLRLNRRQPDGPTLRSAAFSITAYVLGAVAFGIGLALVAGPATAGAFFAGYLTEYSLSVDNLFVFILIMSTFAVPAAHQHKVLLFGIAAALVLRAGFIVAGAAAIDRFIGTFYLFGALLIATAAKLVRQRDHTPNLEHNLVLRTIDRTLPTTRQYHGQKLFVRLDGRIRLTPMLVVIALIASTDLLFALDSIPAIFGLTTDPYIVFTANAFALMGLRQLYVLIRGMLNRLVYLTYGLAVILAFIGAKLILHALHDQFGRPWPDIGLLPSVTTIVVTLALTTAASLVRTRYRDADVPPAGSNDRPKTDADADCRVPAAIRR